MVTGPCESCLGPLEYSVLLIPTSFFRDDQMELCSWGLHHCARLEVVEPKPHNLRPVKQIFKHRQPRLSTLGLFHANHCCNLGGEKGCDLHKS